MKAPDPRAVPPGSGSTFTLQRTTKPLPYDWSPYVANLDLNNNDARHLSGSLLSLLTLAEDLGCSGKDPYALCA